MTQFTYQATSLRSMVKQMLPSAESKNISESLWCTLGVVRQETVNADKTTSTQHVLCMETIQPTFTLNLQMVLATDEVLTDGVVLAVNSHDLDTALASFGQSMVTVTLGDDGNIVLSCQREGRDGAEGVTTGVKTLTISAMREELATLPTPLHGDCTMTDMTVLLDALRSVVGIASKRGNGLSMQGVRLCLDPQHLCVEGENPSTMACMKCECPWLVAPAHRQQHVLSTDCVRHLISALTAYGTSALLRLEMDQDDNCLLLENGGVWMKMTTA